MGPRAGLDVVEERKILPLPGFEPWPYRLSYLDSSTIMELNILTLYLQYIEEKPVELREYINKTILNKANKTTVG
jgi:hypothetical protein